MADTIDRKYFTMVFEGDLRSFEKKPLRTDTPFGRPLAAGFGNAFEDIEARAAAAYEDAAKITDARASTLWNEAQDCRTGTAMKEAIATELQNLAAAIRAKANGGK